MKKVLFVFFSIWIVQVYACDCIWGGNFFELVKSSEVVVKVKIIGHEKLENSFNEVLVAKVIKVFKGVNVADTIKLRGDDGRSCSPYVSYFKQNKQYFLQYNKDENDIPFLYNCGEYYLTITNHYVESEKGLSNTLSKIGKIEVEKFEKSLHKTIHSFNYIEY